MFPFDVKWDRIKEKVGDDVTIVLSPVQRSLLIAVLLSVQYVGENAPDTMNIGSDSDNFDAVLSDLQSKLASAS